ncbi:MAG: hypothetical protein K0S55_888 [Clostridia bacterium]|nr:hypothetical protein [Clostridia bacterium]
MLIKPAFLFLVYVNIKDSDKKFKILIPLPLMFLYFLIEDCFDIISFLNLLSFGRINIKTFSSDLKGLNLNTVIKTSRSFLYHIVFKTGRFDLVDVDVKNKDSHVIVSLKTR